MLKEQAVSYYQKGYNCAEAMILGGNAYYELNLPKESFLTMAAFGGGVNREDLCGAISGGVALLGLIFVKNRSCESEIIKEITQEYVDRFESSMGSLNCKILKDSHRNEVEKCTSVVETSGRILEETVEKYKKHRVK